MSRFRDRRHRHDRFFKKAKKEKFASRAIYKLQTIDERFQILKPGLRVLDLGCWPGGWLQYCADKVGPEGRVVGIDRAVLGIALPGHVTAHQGDVLEVESRTLLADLEAFDVVISDMAPDTSGIRHADVARSITLVERALEMADETQQPGAAFVAKIFVGSGFDDVLQRVKQTYRRVKMNKPEASRKESMEQYIVARERK